MEDAKRPNIRLTFRAGLSSSPPQRREKHLAQEPAQILKFRAVEIPAQKPQNQGHPSQGDSSISNTNMQPPHKGANGVVPSPYLQHAAHTASGYSSHQKSLSPNADPSSTSASMNGFPQSQPKYPYPSNPPHAQSTSPSPTTNGYTFHHFQSRQGSGISSQNGDNEHSHRGIYQPQNFSQQPQSPPNSTPQTRPSTGQTTNGVSPTATPNTQHHGRVPSPVLNRPSMSPTQGNPDVGPVAGVPQRSPTAMSMSPSPYQSFSNQRETNTATPQSHFSHQSSSFTNGEINTRTPNTNISNNQYQHQPFHLSGLSPTKHSPSTATLPAHSVSANPSISSPHLLSATAARSVSGTSIFPPTEMLHPSPNQLSKTPVPTPSKATMATSGAERNELGKVSEQIRDQVSREAEG